jgi:hypothetical protein
MRRYIRWIVFSLYLMVPGFCGAAVFTPIPFNCSVFDSSLVTNVDERIEVSALGFSVLPPQGENWCVKSFASQGLSFLKVPVSVAVFGQPSSPDELFPVTLQAIRFTGLAVDLPDFGFNTESPEQLRVAVDQMISMHIFSQFMGGISSAERRYQLLESHSLVDRSFGASCVRFDAKVEERGMHQAPPGLVMILNFSNNLICAHPQPASSKSPLIWISFVETYREGEQSTADSVRREVDPFLQSLQFMPAR